MSTNLIYNGDFSHGTDSWSGTGVTASNGVLTVTGDLVQDIKYLIPVSSNYRYRLTYDIKFNSKDSNYFYIALRTYDNTKQHISIQTTNRVSNTNTTLASAINNGDTTVALTSSTNWNVATSHHVIGICDKKAWGFNRARLIAGYTTDAISNNTLKLSSAWTQGTIASGTPVACFLSGSGYFYPHYLSSSQAPTDWTTYSVEFNGGNSMRYSCQYFLFTTLGYGHNYSIRNLKIECISDEQTIDWEKYNSNIYKTGIIKTNHFNEIGAKIRYVRDSINGSTMNTYNHWCEFQVLNSIGENIAWGKDLNISGTNFVNSVATDGIVNSSYLDITSGVKTATLDLGYAEEISKIKIWHYYPDGRTYYDNKVEISVDGINWFTIYSGQKPETSAGNEIIVANKQAQLYSNGEFKANQFYEI